jgi:positive phototaxis protein PixI
LETKQKFLSFNLGAKDTALFSLEHVAEVLQVSLGEMTVVPQMPTCVLGVHNWRGEMLWLIDLEAMLGYPPLLQSVNFVSKIMTVVLENEGKYLGILVRQLTDIEWVDIQQIKPASTELFYPEMLPFLQGYLLSESQQMVLVLNALTIIQSPLWGIHN